MFISEIPVRCRTSTGNGDKTIQWMANLTHRTTVRDVIMSMLPTCDPVKYALYIHLDRKKQILNDTARIYKIVAKIHQRQASRRLLFEIRLRKRVRFAEEILVQTILPEHSQSNEKCSRTWTETLAMPLEKSLDRLKENFQKFVSQQQEIHLKRRPSLTIINKNILPSSNDSTVRSHLTTKSMLETLV